MAFVNGVWGLAFAARKAISAKSRYRAFMASAWRRFQVIYPLLRVECGLIHIPATAGLGLLDIVQWVLVFKVIVI
jgi:hypothetical protein